jgi:hypothetical protein
MIGYGLSFFGWAGTSGCTLSGHLFCGFPFVKGRTHCAGLHTHEWQAKALPVGAVHAAKSPDMKMQLHDSAGSRADNGSNLPGARKFLKIFVAYLFCSAKFPRS